MSLAKRNSEAAKAWAAKRRESKERALLQERSSSKSRRPTCQYETTPSKYAASTSHSANAAYMADFRESMANMYLALDGSGAAGSRGDEFVRKAHKDPDPAYLAARSSAPRASPRRSRHLGPTDKSASNRNRRRESEGNGCRSENAPETILLGVELKKDMAGGGAAAGWYRGPLDPAGNVRYTGGAMIYRVYSSIKRAAAVGNASAVYCACRYQLLTLCIACRSNFSECWVSLEVFGFLITPACTAGTVRALELGPRWYMWGLPPNRNAPVH